jgi:hypothetical protein
MQMNSRFVLGVVAVLGGITAATASAFADDVAPPPGFVPGQDAESLPDKTSAPGFLERQDAWRHGDWKPGETDYFPDADDPFRPHQPVGTYALPPAPVLFGPDVTPLPRVWFRAEALYWWTKASPVPVPIVTQGSLADARPGALGQPGTSVLIGDQDMSFGGRGGGRFAFGCAIDPDQQWGLEGSYFFLADESVSQGVASDGSAGSALLALPFFDPTLPGESSTFIANPGSFAGDARLTVTDFLQGVDANLIRNVHNLNGIRLDLLGGFRWVNLQENLSFTTDSPSVAPNSPDFFRTFDRFNANNNFYGGQLGLRASYDDRRLFFNAAGKVALGSTIEQLSVSGGTFTSFGSAPGAYLAQPTNMGIDSRNRFAVVPELNLNFGVRLSPSASIVVGYSFLYVSSVARPGDQIDRVINPSQAPAITGNFGGNLSGPARPVLNVRDTDFWAQGLNFGLQFRY